jgi:hypothetical protein
MAGVDALAGAADVTSRFPPQTSKTLSVVFAETNRQSWVPVPEFATIVFDDPMFPAKACLALEPEPVSP